VGSAFILKRLKAALKGRPTVVPAKKSPGQKP
jgi:hypothetical protein